MTEKNIALNVISKEKLQILKCTFSIEQFFLLLPVNEVITII